MDDREPEDITDVSARAEAEQYHLLGQESYRSGDVEDAAAYYQMSLDLYPTAEAYTSLGVTLAAKGEWQEAIELCELAIELEPDLGNPNNDIGVYLTQMSSQTDDKSERNRLLDEALEWFDKALAAPKNDSRQYPSYHIARILEQRGDFLGARNRLLESLRIDPEWEPAQIELRRILGWLN